MQDYIGDVVDVEFDGYGVWLRANSPDSDKEVYYYFWLVPVDIVSPTTIF